jgi:hypothetical protein
VTLVVDKAELYATMDLEDEMLSVVDSLHFSKSEEIPSTRVLTTTEKDETEESLKLMKERVMRGKKTVIVRLNDE